MMPVSFLCCCESIFAAEFMVRIITIFVFLTGLIAQNFQKQIIVLDYYVNTAAYVKRCENKMRPQMHCNGKCQVAKKLQQQDENAAQNTQHLLQVKVEVVSSDSFFLTATPLIALRLKTAYPPHPQSQSVARSFAIFHPPA